MPAMTQTLETASSPSRDATSCKQSAGDSEGAGIVAGPLPPADCLAETSLICYGTFEVRRLLNANEPTHRPTDAQSAAIPGPGR